MSRLILVKHAMPAITPGQPAPAWPMSDEGRDAAAALAHKLIRFAPASVFSSLEPKAFGTAEAMAQVFGLPVVTDEGLIEHRRETTPFLERAQIEALIAQMFAEPDRLILGEETADEAHDRFAAALERRPRQGGPCVVVCHGTVITLWLSRRFGLEPMPLWRSLGLPSAIALSDDGRAFEPIA